MADFDWNWPNKIDRPLVESQLSLEFLDAARNVVLVAPGGLGKTTIAQNIAHRAILAGRTVLFQTAAQLLLDLAAQESARALERRLRYYANVGLLVLDEVGYLAFDNRNADLLFQVVSRRYERKSIVMTTNLAFKDWHTIFPTATCATALVERVVHHADIIKIEGQSYRLRESELAATTRKAATKKREARRRKAVSGAKSRRQGPLAHRRRLRARRRTARSRHDESLGGGRRGDRGRDGDRRGAGRRDGESVLYRD